MRETCKTIIFALAVICMCAVPGVTAKADTLITRDIVCDEFEICWKLVV